MFGRIIMSRMALTAIAALIVTTGPAGAQEGGAASPEGLRSQASALEADLREQEAALDRKVGELTEVGSQLEEAQARAGEASERVRDLAQQTRSLRRDHAAQEQAVAESRSRFEERIAAAYKGQNLQGLMLLLESVFGTGTDTALDGQTLRILTEDRQSIQYYEENRRLLDQTTRQLEGRKAQYGESVEEQRALVAELGRREAELEGAIEELRGERGRTLGELDGLEKRIGELEAMEEAGLLDPPASGGGEDPREKELRIADEEIVAEPVEELPLSRYRQLYKQAAEDYGFGPDWYVLMAVGKVESNHGENMGPSSAGAMGPMQFLPSTWETAGVDGNGDGVPNIMDPEDAIPAAAKYLADNGAPEDWYAALFAYNRAEWYVREVLEIAEQYRLLAGDESVGPYGIGGSGARSSNASTSAQEASRAPSEAEPSALGEPPQDPQPPQQEPETTEAAPESPDPRANDRTTSEYQY